MTASYNQDPNLIPYPAPDILDLPETQGDLEPPNLDVNYGNDPAMISGPVLEMSRQWNAIDAVVGGTQYLRDNYEVLLPQEPKED